MSLVLYQIADDGTNGIVTPDADAQVYACATGDACGLITGGAVTWLGTNRLQVASGWGIVHGRCFKIEKETVLAATSTYGTKQGRLLLRIDLAGSTPIQFVTQAESTLSDLVQEDFTTGGTIYELPLATYSISTTTVSSLQNVAPQAAGIYGVAAMYTAKLTLSGWTACTGSDLSNGYAYKQTATLTKDNSKAPSVTASSTFVSGVTFTPTGVVATDEILAEVLDIINAGKTVSGNNSVTVYVQEKPTAEINARWAITT